MLAPTRDDAYLDVAMYAGGDAVSEVRPGTFGSDHAEVITSFSFMSCPPARVRRTRVFNYRDADFDGLRRSIHCARWGILADLDVNSAAGLFYDIVCAAISDHVPMVELKTRFPPWFDRSVRACLWEKKIAFRAKKADPSPQNCRMFAERRAEFKELANVK